MKCCRNPSRDEWPSLVERTGLDTSAVLKDTRKIVEEVQRSGDEALIRYTAEFDGVELDTPRFDLESGVLPPADPLREAIAVARRNISSFHEAQRPAQELVEPTPGVRCWRQAVPFERVGLYVPGGNAPLFSTLLMLAIPAQLAGCREIVVTTPPPVNAVVAWIAKELGITSVYSVGGAQAIAALAYGTESVPAVDKIFGPGNQYVTCAKQLVSQLGKTAIDLPAGPSEVLVIADASANPAFVAADLLSQAEHGRDSQVVLVTTSDELIAAVERELTQQLSRLPRKEIAQSALNESLSVLLADLEECLSFSNVYAPEHLILQVEDPNQYCSRITNAGSVFVGSGAPESVGDYASGTNHTLPTAGAARSYSGVSLDSFFKKITFQELTPSGLAELGPHVIEMAEAEGLEAHAEAVRIRLK